MLTIRWTLSILLVLALALPASPGWAQSADEFVAEGQAAFSEGRYEDAVDAFQNAFDLDPHPAILFNLGRALEELGELARALFCFREALQLNPSERVFNALNGKIAAIEQALVDQGYNPDSVTPDNYVPRGTLQVETTPPGATVFIDGEYAGATPFERSRMDATTYVIRVQLDGYHPVQTETTIRGSASTVLTFELVERTSMEEYVPPSPGLLTVASSARGLQVYLDGDPFATTPIEGAALSPGRYLLQVRGDGFTDYSAEIEIRSGEETRVFARMERIGPGADSSGLDRGTAGLILMGGGGALVAGGVVMGILALGQAGRYEDEVANPDRGTFRDNADRDALVADILFGAGVAVAAVGAVLSFTGTDELDEYEQFEQDDLVLGPGYFGRGSFGLFARGSF